MADRLSSYNVLIVEDEELLLKSIARRVENLDMGFHVAALCRNGEEALEVLASQDIHLCITDIRMPVMDGLKLTRIISEKYPETRSILLTGYAEFEYAQQAVKNHVSEYLLKPVTEEDLCESLTRVKLELGRQYELEEDTLVSSHNAEKTIEYVSLYMQNHYPEEIDLAGLSRELGFSPSYLTKIFNRYKGCSPIKYLTDLRICHARHLLSNTSLSIKEVGEKVGYSDQFHFSKVFRKTVGISPSTYRSSQKESPSGSTTGS